MIEVFLDSNIILRHFLQDIPEQSEKAGRIIEEIEKGERVGFVSVLVVNELIWILKRFYNLKRREYIPQILKILQINNIKVVEVKKEVLITILERMKKREVDFTDVYLHQIAGKHRVVSFDQDIEKLEN